MKTAGNTREVQFTAGNNNHCPIQNIFIYDVPAPFIKNEVVAELWGHGITDTHKVYDADGLALYFKAYLSDVVLKINIER